MRSFHLSAFLFAFYERKGIYGLKVEPHTWQIVSNGYHIARVQVLRRRRGWAVILKANFSFPTSVASNR